ncbi:MAG: hypothetical protein ACPGVG_18460 [Mycobacterium sp.]
MQEHKPKWASKTLWANAVGAIAMAATAAGYSILDAGQQEALVGGIMVLANVALRLKTSAALT